jgi:hypothetical protein
MAARREGEPVTRAPQPKWPVTAYPAVYYLVGTRWRLRTSDVGPYSVYAPGKKEPSAMSLAAAKRAVCRTGSLTGETTASIFCVHTDKGDVWLVPTLVYRLFRGQGFHAKTIGKPRLIGEADLDPATMRVAQ